MKIMKLGIRGSLFFMLLHCFAIQLLAQDQSGFISLDCGLVPEDFSYTERTTKLTYISDANFITTGESKSIKDEYKPRFQQQAWSLRSFPRGLRNCYQMNLTKGSRYLIKASFVYGNYDDRNEAPEFDLYIGTNYWMQISMSNATTGMLPEIIHLLTTDQLRVCLVKTGSTTPIISSLEVRPLRNRTYVTKSGSLKTLGRRYIGSVDDPGFIRFPGDIRDRAWITHFENDWTRLTTTSFINNTVSGYDVPQPALRTAVTPKNASIPLNISLPFPPGLQIYVYLHFAETEELKANESRVFNIIYNGDLWWENLNPPYLTATSIYSLVALGPLDGKYEFILQKTGNSTHPPIINAIEIYLVMDLIQPETDENDVDAITQIKTRYGVKRESWQGDPCAPQNYSWDGLMCSYNEFDPPRITSLNLSASGLTGKITHLISNLDQLTNLDLSNNSLTGEVPEFLVQMTSLRVLNLSGNQLTGSVPANLTERSRRGSLILSVERNPDLCESDLCSSNIKKNKKRTVVVPVVVTVVSLSAVIALVSIFLIRKRRKQTRRKGPLRMPPSLETKDRQFSYSAVLKMTNTFAKILGSGGFGAVYQGHLDGKQVAVKLLDETSSQGYKQFKAEFQLRCLALVGVLEVELLLRVHHKYLVTLVGYCDEGANLALIYEIMPNLDLKEHLSGKNSSNILSWEDRLRIASEAAQGLEYLHHGCRPPIIHRDVKTTNILLNENFQAKLSDFGLSRSFTTGSQTHVSTVVAGTLGFLDPEYCMSNWLTEKSDVYSFGVVLLEIITNRLVIDRRREKVHLSDWVNFMLREGDIGKIVDLKLGGSFGTNSAWKYIEVALACVSQSSSRRPSMTHVVKELNECLAIETARNHGSHEMNSNNSMTLAGEENGAITELMPSAR